MRGAAAALVAIYALTACAGGGTTAGAPPAPTSSPSPSTAAGTSSSPTPIPPPPDMPFTTQLDCARPVTTAHGLALYALYTTPPRIEVLDVSHAWQPALVCMLSPAQGGSFDQAPNQVVFWIGAKLGSADLTTGKAVQTAQLPAEPSEGVFSRDGATFAYRATDDTAGSFSTHIFGGGRDHTLYHEGPVTPPSVFPFVRGPFGKLEFSADGTELLDFVASRPASGLDKFLVYKTSGILGSGAATDTSRIFQSNTASTSVWSPTGSTLYFFVESNPGPTGRLVSLDRTGRQQTLASGMTGLLEAQMSPTGGSILYDNYVTPSGDTCGGVPHLSTFDLASRQTSQLSTAISWLPVFITPTVVWSIEGHPSQCGPPFGEFPSHLCTHRARHEHWTRLSGQHARSGYRRKRATVEHRLGAGRLVLIWQ